MKSANLVFVYISSLFNMIEHLILISNRVDELIEEAAQPTFDPPKKGFGKAAYHEVDAANFIYERLSEEDQSNLLRKDVIYYLVVHRYARHLNLSKQSQLAEKLFDKLDPKFTIERQEEMLELHIDYLQSIGVAKVDWFW